MPEKARQKLSIAAVPLTVTSLLADPPDNFWLLNSLRAVRGEGGCTLPWALAYQVVSKLTNNKKREACNRCLAGKTIPLPDDIMPFKSAYKQRFDEDDLGCFGCFWFDLLRPKCPDLFPASDLQSARAQFILTLRELQAAVRINRTKKSNSK